MRGEKNMYFNILKKDIKRKKVMNSILLLFIIIASALIGSSLNMFYSTVSSIDYTIKKSNVSDVLHFNMN